jgi:CheY-like chemotaxis protein
VFTQDEFSRHVRDALNHLYDSPYLQAHPLAAWFSGPEATPQERSQMLRQTVLDAIRTLRPPAGTPAGSPDWRLCRILELRYVEGLAPNEAMERLALEKSRYFQEQARAMDTVTAALWAQVQAREVPTSDGDSGASETSPRQEVERLLAEARWEPVELEPVLGELTPMLNALALAHAVEVTIGNLPNLTVLRADRVILRQMLLNVLTHALYRARGGWVEITTLPDDNQVGLRVLARPSLRARALVKTQDGFGRQEGDNLDVGRWLMQSMNGTLQVTTDTPEGPWEAHLNWPVTEPLTLLVIDDNQGLIDLFRRYLTGYGWQVIGARSSAEAREFLAHTLPTVIMLDVMIPGEDGWEVLMALKGRQDTQNTPVIVCSVLSVQPLAQALGAAGYLSKPVTRQTLLRALARWRPGGNQPAPVL